MMPGATAAGMPTATRELRNRVSIVGIGETDYGQDFQSAKAKAAEYSAPSPEQLAATAFERALADSGLSLDAIDGLSVSFIYGGPSARATADLLGLKPDFCIENGGVMAGPLPVVCEAIASGKCATIAMIYGAATRAIGRQFGGGTHTAGAAPSSYYYHHPWGWSSQAAHWAFAWQHYKSVYGAEDADLAHVAMQVRRNAMANANAIMRSELTPELYLKAKFIVRPLRLLDLCLVNDGGVCLIVTKADLARDLPHAPVHLSGWGEAKIPHSKMDFLVRERLRPQCQEASAQAFAMAGLSLSDIQHFEGYDASSIHLVNQMEGFGLSPRGESLAQWRAGEFGINGSTPVNTAGGMLSESYMHGWNQITEIVRQLRHEAGVRQIPDIQASLFSLAQTDEVHPMIFTRGI